MTRSNNSNSALILSALAGAAASYALQQVVKALLPEQQETSKPKNGAGTSATNAAKKNAASTQTGTDKSLEQTIAALRSEINGREKTIAQRNLDIALLQEQLKNFHEQLAIDSEKRQREETEVRQQFEQELSSKTNQIASLQSSIQDLQTTISSLESQNRELKERVAELEKKPTVVSVSTGPAVAQVQEQEMQTEPLFTAADTKDGEVQAEALDILAASTTSSMLDSTLSTTQSLSDSLVSVSASAASIPMLPLAGLSGASTSAEAAAAFSPRTWEAIAKAAQLPSDQFSLNDSTLGVLASQPATVDSGYFVFGEGKDPATLDFAPASPGTPVVSPRTRKINSARRRHHAQSQDQATAAAASTSPENGVSPQ